MSNEILGLLALGVLFAAIFIGFPIAFTLGAVALGTGWIALGPVVFDLGVLQTYSVMKDTVLAAIPFFLFMGFLLEQSGIMERLFTGIQQLLSGLNGSLYLAVLITATIFAAATGIVGQFGHAAGRDGRAVDDQERLRPQDECRRHHRRRHAGHPDPAQRDADRDGAGGGRARHRPVRRGRHSRPAAVDPVHHLDPGALLAQPQRWARRCRPRCGLRRWAR
jgi:hypothetical protein